MPELKFFCKYCDGEMKELLGLKPPAFVFEVSVKLKYKGLKGALKIGLRMLPVVGAVLLIDDIVSEALNAQDKIDAKMKEAEEFFNKWMESIECALDLTGLGGRRLATSDDAISTIPPITPTLPTIVVSNVNQTIEMTGNALAHFEALIAQAAATEWEVVRNSCIILSFSYFSPPSFSFGFLWLF